MDKKIQRAIIEYVKKVKEAARIDIVNKVNQKYRYSMLDVKESINILESDKKLRKTKTAPRDSMYDFFCLTRKGYETLAPLYKRVFYFLRNIVAGYLKIKVNIDT